MAVSKKLGLENLEGEVWKEVKGFEGHYEVSNLGRVKSVLRRVRRGNWTRSVRERILSACPKDNLYLYVTLSKHCKNKSHHVHRIVATAFLENCENKKTVNHKNGVKGDNRVENLEWTTYKENSMHAVENNLLTNKGELHGNSKIKEDIALEIKNNTHGIFQRDIAEKYGISQTQVSRIKRGANWGHLE